MALKSLSVLELEEIELPEVVDANVNIVDHVSVLRCGVVVDGVEDGLCKP